MTDEQRIKDLEKLVSRMSTDISNLITMCAKLVEISCRPPTLILGPQSDKFPPEVK